MILGIYRTTYLFKLLYILLSLFLISHTAQANMFSSTDKRVDILELYTSEGCSSCPPADKWLSALQQQQGLWSQFIPLAFHVDYWDWIGWTDRYADKRFSQRQYTYTDSKNLSSVYTPAMVLNGQEWRKRPWITFPDQNQESAGTLSVNISNKQLNANYQTTLAKNQSLVLNIALLGFGLESTIKSGENQGKTLNHDFVVLGYKTVAMQPAQDSFIANAISLPDTLQQSDRQAIAIWVNTLHQLTPLQATGGWLD